MIWVFSTLFVVYVICMLILVFGFKKVPLFSEKVAKRTTGFSIVIPFRNEAENLSKLLETIEGLHYPSNMFEIIFVNDASEDTSEQIISEATVKSKLSINLIQNRRRTFSPKKDAITEAVKHANFEWIATTDADCELPKSWLTTLDGFIKKNKPMMVCGPVLYKSNGSFIENFQQLDALSLQAVTIGSIGYKNILLSNGANLTYKKEAFIKVNGFKGNDHIGSGDDIFLMEKIKQTFPKKVLYLKSKDAIVITKPQKNWKAVLNQRIRWASKISKQQNKISYFLGMLVFLVNISVLALPFLMIFDSENTTIYIALLGFKIITDYIVLLQSGDFFDIKISFWKFIRQPFLYAIVIVAVVVGSLDGTYLWKGRTFKKAQQTN
ncbi:glycosyltransferase family 2 protein [Aequorivita marisscotiae]|uniref:Glycosyltransferase n=1 Tax=Aequorivita marisscotiae TaxID=3040348 RepID=A0ABY8KW37_9FLAO|nr:glycosyltransferase [Aequorivita sp. Ant34-E75]WGF93173.1 glycosyltransferase [Aequorivita sp. Ant34-E75]